MLRRKLGFPAIVTRFYLKTMPDFPVQLNSVYIYPIQEYDALKTWLNEVMCSTLLILHK